MRFAIFIWQWEFFNDVWLIPDSRSLIMLRNIFDITERERNRWFFRDRTLKRGFRRERSKLRFRLISRRMLWLSSSVQTKLGVNLDFSAGARWIAISIAMQRRSSRRPSRVFRELSEGFLKFRMPTERSIKFFKWISSYFRPRIKELHGSSNE